MLKSYGRYEEGKMEKRSLGKTGILVSPVSFGVLTVGKTQLDLPLEEGAGLIKHALSRGINFFDTAQYYETYPYLREALKNTGRGEKPVICSKSLCHTYREMEYAVYEALKELELETIDIFLLHEVRQAPDFENRRGAWECLLHMKEKGIIKAAGISTHHVDVAEMAAELPECDVLFPLINYAGLGIRKGSGAGTAREMRAAIEKNIEAGKGVFAMKAFGGGNLTGEYIKALDYVFSIEGISSVMVGIGAAEEIDRLVEYAEGTLPRDYAPDISGKKIRIDQGDCEGCGACIKRCPNKAIYRDSRGIACVDHSICLTCGYCAPVCPVRAIIMF